MKWILCFIFFSFLESACQEQELHSKPFESYLLTQIEENEAHQKIYLEFLKKQKQKSNQAFCSELFYKETKFFLYGLYCVQTLIEKDLNKSFFYIEQHLYAAADLQKALCILKAGIIQTLWDNHCFLSHIETATHYQKKGYGSCLMGHLEALARNAHCEKIILDSKQEAVQFYEKLGFKQDYDRDSSYDNCIAMVKYLNERKK